MNNFRAVARIRNRCQRCDRCLKQCDALDSLLPIPVKWEWDGALTIAKACCEANAG